MAKHVLNQVVSADGSEYHITLYDDAANSIEQKKVLVSAVTKDAGMKPEK